MSAIESNPYDAPTAKDAAPAVKASYLRATRETIVLAVFLFLGWAFDGSLITAFGLAFLVVAAQAALLFFTLIRPRRVANAVSIRLLKFGVYVVTLVAMLLYVKLEHRIAREEAERIVQACQSYADDHGRFPDHLSELVPDYLPSVPSKLGFIGWKPYFYSPATDGSTASFMYSPEPFFRRWYDFGTRKWKSYLS